MSNTDCRNAFWKIFKTRDFESFEELSSDLKKFQDQWSIKFSLYSSKLDRENSTLKYEWIVYKCDKYRRRRSRSTGKKRVYTTSTNCPTRIIVRNQNGVLVVTSHCMRCNHPRDAILYGISGQSGQLDVAEQEAAKDLLGFDAPTSRIKDFALERFGKHLKTQAINYLRRKYRSKFHDDFESVFTGMRQNGRVLSADDAQGYTHIAFSRQDQIELFARFPEVVCVDGTHGTNRDKYMLYQFLVMDGTGSGRTVMTAFIRSETYEDLHTLMILFRTMMGELACRKVCTFVVDKMAAQMKAIREVFNCKLMLCYFHLRQAIRRKNPSAKSCNTVHLMAMYDNEQKFTEHFREIQNEDPDFAQYFNDNWVVCKDLWAVHAQSGVVHLGNLTNNRIENAHGRLKKWTDHKDRLVITIQKIWRYFQGQMRDYHTQVSMACRRRLLAGNAYINGMLNRMTLYAGEKLLQHLRKRPMNLDFTEERNAKFIVEEGQNRFEVDTSSGTCDCVFNESMLMPCNHIISVFKGLSYPSTLIPIKSRWVAQYNIPQEKLVLVNPTKPSRSTLGKARLLHSLLQKAIKHNHRRAEKLIDVCIKETQELMNGPTGRPRKQRETAPMDVEKRTPPFRCKLPEAQYQP